MKQYYIKNKDGDFWCEHHMGFWSSFKHSLKYRFEGNIFWVMPLFVMIKIMSNNKPKLVRI